MSSYKFAVILSGCGVYDGAEIHEAVATLFAIDQAGSTAICFAPDIWQHHVIDHTSGAEMNEKRNVLVESARIARGDIHNIAQLNVTEVDALIFPGGFGAAKNLCTFAFDGEKCQVNEDVREKTLEFHKSGKPIGALCIAPALLTAILHQKKPTLTIGNDESTAEKIETMGGVHQICPADQCVHDKDNRIFTTPAYMSAGSISEVFSGAQKLISEIIAELNSR